jgi:hypothetical protein
MCSRGSPITRSLNWPLYYHGIGATQWLLPAPPDIAAPASAVTISRVAEIPGEDEGLLWEMVDEMEPEDGCLWIYGTGDSRLSPSRPPGRNICGSCSPSTNVIGYPPGLERMVEPRKPMRPVQTPPRQSIASAPRSSAGAAPAPTAPRFGSSHRLLHRCKSGCLHRCEQNGSAPRAQDGR